MVICIIALTKYGDFLFLFVQFIEFGEMFTGGGLVKLWQIMTAKLSTKIIIKYALAQITIELGHRKSQFRHFLAFECISWLNLG